MQKFFKFLIIISILFLGGLILINPEISLEGAANGLFLCGRVIIPSLFPFAVCVLFAMKSDIVKYLSFISPISEKFFNLNYELFSVLILSMLGGYPIGAKLLNEKAKENKISGNSAGIMLNYCVNAGPGFIILAVGKGMLGSKTIGYILFFAHIISSLIMAVIFGLFIKKDVKNKTAPKIKIGLTDSFVNSVSDAASSVFAICSYVIFFSVIMSFTKHYSEKIIILNLITPLLEVTNSIPDFQNILAVAFLLGFAGISIWCQILSMSRLIKIKLSVFIASRITHGVLSACITAVLLKVFKISVTASAFLQAKPFYDNIALSFSMLSMVIILIISLFGKNSTGNIIKDIV